MSNGWRGAVGVRVDLHPYDERGDLLYSTSASRAGQNAGSRARRDTGPLRRRGRPRRPQPRDGALDARARRREHRGLGFPSGSARSGSRTSSRPAEAELTRGARPYLVGMTAKEQLLVVVGSLTEAEATDALEYISRRRPAGTSTEELLDNAPLDDERFREADEQALAETRGRRDRVSLADARSELL